MKYITTTQFNRSALDVVLLLVRVFIGFAMLSHGYPKLVQLMEGNEIQFYSFLGLSPKISLFLAVFAEFICSIFLILGLFTRLAVLFLAITMVVAGLVVHGADTFDKRELSLVYLSLYLIFLVVGAGKYSIDYLITKRKSSSGW